MVDVGFWGGLVPENGGADASELRGMLRLGAVGFKAFMSPSGIDDFGRANASHLAAGLRALSPFGRTLMVHAELPYEVESAEGKDPRRCAANQAHTRSTRL